MDSLQPQPRMVTSQKVAYCLFYLVKGYLAVLALAKVIPDPNILMVPSLVDRLQKLMSLKLK